jgi:glycosyltransferase involved in cell wall biosynthesis
VSVNLVEALAKCQDLETHVVTMDRACRAPTVEPWRGAIVHRLPWTGRNMLTYAVGAGRRQMQAYLAQLRPDLVHAHDTYGLMVQGMPVPRVFTIHGFIHADTRIAGGWSAWPRSVLWRWAETACWAEQLHIIAISPYVRERLRGIATGTIHDIENAVAEDFFRVPRNERPGTVFSAALIGPRKNTLGLLEAFARVAEAGLEAELRLAGAISDTDYGQRVRDFIEARGLRNRVTLLGGIGADKVREELARASVFALVSLEEGAPMGVAEAMAAGIPVVTSNRCGMPYMVRDGESGYLVDPLDPDDIAARLKQIVADDGLRAAMCSKSRQIAEDRFHPHRVATRTRDVYRRAIETFRDGR